MDYRRKLQRYLLISSILNNLIQLCLSFQFRNTKMTHELDDNVLHFYYEQIYSYSLTLWSPKRAYSMEEGTDQKVFKSSHLFPTGSLLMTIIILLWVCGMIFLSLMLDCFPIRIISPSAVSWNVKILYFYVRIFYLDWCSINRQSLSK